MRSICITNLDSDRRLDKYLAAYMNAAPKSFLYKMLRKKRIKLNGIRAEGGEILEEGDVIDIYMTDETISGFMRSKIVKPFKGELDVIYEDDLILLINKPIGLISHSDKKISDTLQDRVLYYLYKKNAFDVSCESTFTPAICNRLDRNTSGIIVCGKTLSAIQSINKMFAKSTIKKEYIAAVTGVVNSSDILKSTWDKNRETNKVSLQDKPQDSNTQKQIITEYTPIRSNTWCTLLKIYLYTGRSHQIRAHMQSIDHPILGDPKYGDPEINKKLFKYQIRSQLLHSEKITFMESDGILSQYNNRSWSAHIPERFKSFINFEFKGGSFL